MNPTSASPLVGSLALGCVRPRSTGQALRAVGWHRGLLRLGLRVPLFAVHDLGLLITTDAEDLVLVGPAAGAIGREEDAARYSELVEELASMARDDPPLGRRASDELVIALLARLFGSVARSIREEPERGFDLAWRRALGEARVELLTRLDALDAATLSLLGGFGSTSKGALDVVDVIAALESTQANDIARFSLEILPSVLETKALRSLTPSAALGYAGLSRRGSLDSLILTELVWDEEELLRRIAEDEVLYYAREQGEEISGRRHLLLIDASASMRGERSTFARGTALALAEQLLLAGEDVTFRFFDSRLYERERAHGGRLPVARLLGFKGERGRNPHRVFAELVTVLDMERRQDPRQPVVHILTHGALYIPRQTVEALKQVARVSAIYMLPSGGRLELDYLDLLDAHWVVDHATLASQRARADKARSILRDAQAAFALETVRGAGAG